MHASFQIKGMKSQYPLFVKIYPETQINTDVHGKYKGLNRLRFSHGTVYHKYEFINRLDNVNTQALESFNYQKKRYMKSRRN